jgi:hypothetical protein
MEKKQNHLEQSEIDEDKDIAVQNNHQTTTGQTSDDPVN